MIRHIIAGIATVLALWACFYMYSLDKEVHKLDKIADLIEKTKMEDKKIDKKLSTKPKPIQPIQQVQTSQPNSKSDEMEKKLKALKDRAGNLAAFETSALYKKKCSSCHGNIGQGIIGPKLLGRDKEYILQGLKDFKAGKRKNYVMYGLLGSLSDEQLDELASEISTFQQKLDEATKK